MTGDQTWDQQQLIRAVWPVHTVLLTDLGLLEVWLEKDWNRDLTYWEIHKGGQCLESSMWMTLHEARAVQ